MDREDKARGNGVMTAEKQARNPVSENETHQLVKVPQQTDIQVTHA